MKKNSGYTIVELMAVVAVIGILSAIAFSSFQYLVVTNNSAELLNKLKSHVNLARAEAIRRNTSVSICATNNPNQADNPATPLPACNGTAVWTAGWIVFVDNNGNGSRDAAEILLTTGAGVKDQSAFIANNINAIVVNTRGFPGSKTFTFTPSNCKGNQKLNVTLTTSGDITKTNTACP